MFGFEFKKVHKKNVDFIVYVLEVSPNTLAAYSSKSPRYSVSILTFTLAALNILAKFQEQESKRTLLYVCLIPFVYVIGNNSLKV